MKTLTQRWLTAVFCALCSLAAQAEPVLNGIAPYTKLGQEQFLAGLYLPSTTADTSTALAAGGERRIELRVTANSLSTRGLNRMWIEGMAINIPSSALEKNADGMVAFTRMTKGRLTNGDTITIDDMPSEGIEVHINGISMGKIRRAPDLFNMLLSTWIGSVPLSSDFRSLIMAGGNLSPETLARFRATTPSAERVAAVEAWGAPKAEPATAKPAVVAKVETAKPTPKVTTPSVSAPSVAAPTVIAPTLAATTAPAPVTTIAATVEKPAAVTPKQAEKPKPAAAAQPKPVNTAFLDEDELDEDEEPLLTAASLLSRQLYNSKLLKWTYKNIRYPKRALQRNQEGSVRIAVVIDRNGKVLNTQALEESSHSLLNSEALKAVERSDPFPPMPQDLSGERFEFTLPITFAIPD